MEVHLALANKDRYGELLGAALAFPELVSLLLDQTKLHLSHSNPLVLSQVTKVHPMPWRGCMGLKLCLLPLLPLLPSLPPS